MSDAGTAPRRRARITRSGDFDAVYRRGRSAANRHLVVYAFSRDDRPGDAPARLGLSVSKKVGGAVERNRVKRVLREQFAAIAPGLPGGIDVVVIARPGAAEYVEERGSAALGARLAELAERATATSAA
ncbi:ribonuclease P protein component [Miltoncostaea oceani]|uniref:ribonuclease P protein component n=1 Tax=Miltoncostaea oceani TaxID=2843216 RepID=UPI001C3D8ECF|nr:ribonuclease P protein component [Miltoncostaea oceani]